MDRRTFLWLGAGAVCASQAPAFAQTVAEPRADIRRTGPDQVRLEWQGLGRRAKVFASSDSQAPEPLMRVLSERADAALTARLAPMPRPYFLISGDNNKAVRVAERVLPLEGGRNFRDLGGYHTQSGGQVRWGRMYRSGVMSELTANDLVYLAHLGIETVCDFRSRDEMAREPSKMAGQSGTQLVTFDYAMDMSTIGPIMAAKTRAEATRAFAAGYVGMAGMLKRNFTDLFARLARNEAPLALNCSAGKDRTGVASALILSALGVPRDTVIADYALSETLEPPEKYIAAMRNPAAGGSAVAAEQAAFFARMSEPALRVLMGSDADVMRIMLTELDDKHGGPLGFAKTHFGVDDAMVATLRSLYVA